MAEDQLPGLNIPKGILPFTDEEFEKLVQDEFVTASLSAISSRVLSDREYQRLLVSLLEERNKFNMMRRIVGTTSANMVKPKGELVVLFSAASAALDKMFDDPDSGMNILTQAVNEVALSMAGKLDLDLLAWAQRDLDWQADKWIEGMGKLFPDIPALDSLAGANIQSRDLNATGPSFGFMNELEPVSQPRCELHQDIDCPSALCNPPEEKP